LRISDCGLRISARIRERGPLTVAAFMELALYDAEFGYYARAAQRSGRAGDFFTSVDVGPLFGALLEIQIAEMATRLGCPERHPAFDLVEAGAGNGRLSADILAAMRERDPALLESVRLHLVEASAAARAQHGTVLGDSLPRLASSSASLPDSVDGVIVANELLDAMPVHQVVRRDHELHEIYVDADGQGLRLTEGPLSSPRIADYLERLGVELEPGWRAEISLAAVDWIREAARRLRRGFIILIDYGHEAPELYSVTHSSGTLTTFSGHRSAGPESAVPAWLASPGERDITAHVDFTSVRLAAEAAGLTTIAFLDQTYFLLGLVTSIPHLPAIPNVPAIPNLPSIPNLSSIRNPQSAIRNLQTLVLPGGLGSTHKVLILGQNVGMPALKGCSFKVRVT
jgi:SAM-dependent MidA family methyltransferase